TGFNLHGLRQKLDSAPGAAHGAGRAKASMVDATNVKRLDTAGALEILQLAGGPEAEIKAAEEHAQLFKVVKENMHVPPAPRHVDWLVHLLEEIGHDMVDLGRQILNLCAFMGEIIVIFVEACVQPKRFRIGAVVRQMLE